MHTLGGAKTLHAHTHTRSLGVCEIFYRVRYHVIYWFDEGFSRFAHCNPSNNRERDMSFLIMQPREASHFFFL